MTRPAAGPILVHLGRAARLVGMTCLGSMVATTSHDQFVKLAGVAAGLGVAAVGMLWAGRRLAAQEREG